MPAAAATRASGHEAAASWRAIGTGVHLLVTELRSLGPARRLLREDLAALDAACSRFRSDSELVALDHAPGDGRGRTGPVQVSPLLAGALAVALRAARRTGGDVDPTVGNALSAAGYDRDFALVQRDGPPVRLTVRSVSGLDLGATAKAWAADRAAARIAAELGCGVLVNLGGDIAVAGMVPDGGWRVRVQDVTGPPEEPPAGPSAMVAIRSGGLATSSTAARRWHRGGDVLHHILDPRSGLPAAPVWRTVSVAAATCTDANTASTAAIIRGEAALAWLAELGFPARLVAESGAVVTLGGWPPDQPSAS
jgi:thiamine biosynthesis lipoprotein ApbE